MFFGEACPLSPCYRRPKMRDPAPDRGYGRDVPAPWSAAAREAQRLGTDLDALRRNAQLTPDERLAQLEEFLALREASRV